MARAITGRATPPRFTTGPSTRHALSAAGALGATTGSVVHLFSPPTADPVSSGVLAHELAHTRRHVGRPRFLLTTASGTLDDDEREALAAGRGSLGTGSLGTGSLGTGSLSPGPLGTGAVSRSAVDTNAVSRTAVSRNAVDRNAVGAGPVGRSALGGGTPAASVQPEAVGAGIVGRLPVGAAMAAVAEIAMNTARATVLEATAATSLLGPHLPGSAAETAATPVDSGAGDNVHGGNGGPAMATTPDPGPGPAGPSAPAAMPGPPAGANAPGPPLDPDRIVDVVEQRLLHEIERRGGRWAGVF
jgi:hypothetical protein